MNKLTISILTSLSIFFISFERMYGQESQQIINENPLGIPLSSEINNNETVFIVLRHAEKQDSGKDPNLSNAGNLRAEELKRLLKNVDINSIYSTPYNRTKQTVSPLAVSKGLIIKEYIPSNTVAENKIFVNTILSQNQGKIVVVVGHSNTVSDLVKVLSNNVLDVSIGETQFDNIFITKNKNSGESVFAVQKKYGESTPN